MGASSNRIAQTISLSAGHKKFHGADIEYVPRFLSREEADELTETLKLKVPWRQPKVRIFGSLYPCPRLAASYGDQRAIYQYSGVTNYPLMWLTELSELRCRIENYTEDSFNSVLVNCYRTGLDSMGWHRDNEPELGIDPVIASITLGSSRRFVMRHCKRRDVSRLEVSLENGSLLIMRGQTQSLWQHTVPKTRMTTGLRLNLTFRNVLWKRGCSEFQSDPISEEFSSCE
ncbi:MAG: alpha-ketoglutarate-dependent dioxygenase AlkB [Acidiferrobacteraceae bacterium]|mgnify:CR=1 FL=1|nr:alpha-ketoglutarate-dependent dioxygenase AlkB [Acidiferrobacteraceae bacterium]